MYLSKREQRRLHAKKSLKRTKKTNAKCHSWFQKEWEATSFSSSWGCLARICLKLPPSSKDKKKIPFNNKRKQKPNSTGKVEAEKGSSDKSSHPSYSRSLNEASNKKSVHGLSSLILASSWISPHQKSEAPADQKASSQLPSDPVTLEVHTGQTWQAVQPEKRKMGPDWKFKENLGFFWGFGFFFVSLF